jgi:hypothetical protein|tara:strand:+ start:215 stop:556 length:342 start_codon:yes stop_codon:yes gene_type:complete
MMIEIKEVKRIDEGKHHGMIKAVEYRTQPFEYTDLVLEFEDGKLIKYGVPSSVTMESKLGKLLLEFGAGLEVGQSIDPEQVFLGKPVTFMTQNKTTPRGTFPSVVPDSLRLVR